MSCPRAIGTTCRQRWCVYTCVVRAVVFVPAHSLHRGRSRAVELDSTKVRLLPSDEDEIRARGVCAGTTVMTVQEIQALQGGRQGPEGDEYQ